MQILRKTLFWKRCVFQPSHWCDSFPQENKTRSLPYLLDYFPISRPPSLLWSSPSSLEKKHQISRRLPRQVVSHPEPPLYLPVRCSDSHRDLEQGPLQTPPAPRHGTHWILPAPLRRSTAQRFSVLLKVTGHVLNSRRTPFPLANKELLVFRQEVKRL